MEQERSQYNKFKFSLDSSNIRIRISRDNAAPIVDEVDSLINEIRNELNTDSTIERIRNRENEYFIEDFLIPHNHEFSIESPLVYDESNRNSNLTTNYDNVGTYNYNFVLGKDVIKKYGRLNVITFKKLLKNRLIILTPLNDMIFKKIVEIFHKIFSKKNPFVDDNLINSNDKLDKFISCLPSLSTILRLTNKTNFNNKKRRNEIYLIKICLDIYYNYYKSEDILLFKVRHIIKVKSLLKRCLKVMVVFYSKLEDKNIKFIYERFINDGLDKFEFLNFNGKEQYIDYYIREMTNLMQLIEGVEIKHFIN